MPIYEYRCEACGHTLDALQKVADAPLSECPACGKPALKRLISAPAFRLKGSGWYETDFKSDKDKKRNLAETGRSESVENSKNTGKAESGDAKKSPKGDEKPAGKADKKSKNGSGSEAA
jgi:putative FmdB family regulatory protein